MVHSMYGVRQNAIALTAAKFAFDSVTIQQAVNRVSLGILIADFLCFVKERQ